MGYRHEPRVRLDVTADQMEVLRDAVAVLVEEKWPRRQREKFAELWEDVEQVAHLLNAASNRFPKRLYDAIYWDAFQDAIEAADHNPDWINFFRDDEE